MASGASFNQNALTVEGDGFLISVSALAFCSCSHNTLLFGSGQTVPEFLANLDSTRNQN